MKFQTQLISHQKKDGSWGYSLANTGGWTDNYHTGYVLDCIDEYQKLAQDNSYSENIERGYSFYMVLHNKRYFLL